MIDCVMFGLLKSRPPVDDDEYDWLVACFAWLTREFGGNTGLRGATLVLPSREFFPHSKLTGHDRALELFDQVKALAGMTEWQCDLIPGAASREYRVTTGHALKHEGRGPPLGTFGYADGRYYVTYNPTALADPAGLIATFAHELSHYLIHTAETPPPGGRDLEEHATDLAAVFMGFGVLMANSAKSFDQFQNFGEMGWQMQARGYLSENALATGLALFVAASGADASTAQVALKDYLRKPFRRALKAIRRDYPDLSTELRDMDLADWR
jgi:hypothetical protein